MQNTRIDRSMRRTFNEIALTELKNLWLTGEYTKSDLARKYECSVTTVCLWLNPDDIVRVAKFRSRQTRTGCDCGRSYATHPKCAICRINTHNAIQMESMPSFYKNGLKTQDSVLCDACHREYIDRTIEFRGVYKIGADMKEYRVTMNPYTKEIKLNL